MIQSLRSIHAWIGIFVMPWIIMIGITGLYLNHAKAINSMLYRSAYDETRFDTSPTKREVDSALAHEISKIVWAAEYSGIVKEGEYHKRAVFIFKEQDTKLIISKETAHYWVKSKFTRKTFDPNNQLLDTKIYWGTIFKYIHSDGWVGGGLGSWLADITAGAMVIFGMSGMILFSYPRIRRLRNSKRQLK